MTKLIILDRDGVINYDSPDFIKSPEEWIPIPNSLEAIAKLTQAGFIVSIASNQSGIARGLYTLEALQLIHQKMQTALQSLGSSIDKIVFCSHLDEDECHCRKPKPGLLNELLDYYKINPNMQTIPYIGDSLRDLQAAMAASCQPILVLSGNGEETLKKLNFLEKEKRSFSESILIYKDLFHATQSLIEKIQ